MDNIKEKINNLINDKEYGEIHNCLRLHINEKPTLNDYIYAERIFNKIAPNLNNKTFRIAILRSITIEPLIPYLTVKCFLNGITPEIYLGGYNIFEQEILNNNSPLYGFSPDVLILFTRIEELAPEFLDNFIGLESHEIDYHISGVLQKIDNLVSMFRNNSKAKIIIHNFEVPENPAFGIVDAQQKNSQKVKLIELNLLLNKLLNQYNESFVLDYEHLISRVGKKNWFDEKLWYTSKMPISRTGLEALANEYIRFIKPSMGMTKKCLVLDLDNTLWGGVLGEEGVDGIKIGNNYPGIEYLEFQREILKLYKKGFLLAINSKNNAHDVTEVFEQNNKMLLKFHHFAAVRINWQDKAQNMKEIANELNIGLDSLVYFDDNPVERELIRQSLPQVQVVEMPQNSIHYKRTLLELDSFEMMSYSDEDMKRGELYYQQSKRMEEQASFSNLDDFYRSLGMVAIIQCNDLKSVQRLAQMTQKTNQFNLTTIRYTETDINTFIRSGSYRIYSLKLADKFGDNGIVGEIIIKEEKNNWIIDSFLISCRVMGRTVETAFLSYIINEAVINNISSILGKYIQTNKNEPVKNIYEDHGFTVINEKDKIKEYIFDTKNCINCPEWIKIETI